MGLTGFNRQRKQALSKELGIDMVLADKLMSFGYSTPESVRKADGLLFLSEDERKQLSGSNATEKATEKEAETEQESTTESEHETPGQVETTNELDDKFLALPEDTEFPSHYGGGNYYLSNGEKVSGKAEAKAAQDQLNGG